ncbi:unnamed protein product [Chironomus riparius]|uniref:BTB domain-containing protein n=1 Tax=Chironomus riparius TaxID=315576 RepID=A0A9N9RYU6_9DIPT|nr:unnamed protein product [Chironomus riparius]
MDLNKSSSRSIEWKIYNVVEKRLKEGKKLQSNTFEIIIDKKATKWYFLASIKNSKIAFYLHMQRPKATGFLTKLEIYIPAISNDKEINLKFIKDYSMINYSGWGWKSLISLTDLFENPHEYLNNGTLSIGTKIELINAVEDDVNNSSITYFKLNETFKIYFDEKLFTDMTFLCSDGIEIQAHRFAIFASSSVLKNMINLGPNSIIEVDDIDSETMTEILRYIYTDEVNDIDDFAPKLIYGAIKYELDELTKLCKETVAKNISFKNAIEYFLLADKFDMKDLLDCCINFIKTNHKVLVQNKHEWDKLDKKHLNVLLDYYHENGSDIIIFESSF